MGLGFGLLSCLGCPESLLGFALLKKVYYDIKKKNIFL
jgi:hypothetical protein